ncbi:MAG: polymerase subunit gamma/tau [Blastocatellia bacterium]|jgi:DNA polymerase-3 subunit gamma/tau|nr:polymerase subunit gamma/tau [Blastocatellia bacterium]
MSYQVIARKWRPQTFDEVTGQEPITRTLRNAIEHERLHHAYLFSGARGVGKTTTARLLAKALNCHKAKGPTPTPCRTDDETICASCREIGEGRSIDVLEIDAASNTGVDNVRDAIIGNVAIAPARDRYKVFIIDEVHMLSGAAFNALLKTLEEPPPRVVFIMATTELHKLPDTILSRCQQFEFRTIATTKIAERLRLIAGAEKVSITDDALREIARAGEGSMRDAQSAFDQVISFSGAKIAAADVETALGIAGTEMLARVMRAVAEQRPAEALAVVDDLVMRGHDLRNFCRSLLSHLRDLLVAKVSGETTALLDTTATDRAELMKQADAFSESDLVRFFHSLTETETNLRAAAHPRYQLEIGLVKLMELRRIVSVNHLIERLSALEESLRTGKAPAAAAGSTPPAAASGGGQNIAGRGGQSNVPPRTPRAGNAMQNNPPAHTEVNAYASSPELAPASYNNNAAPALSNNNNAAPPASSNSNVAPEPPVLTLVPPPGPAPVAATTTNGAAAFAAKAAPESLDIVGQRVPVGSAPQPGSTIEAIKAGLEKRRRMFLVVALEGARRVVIEGDELCIEYAPEAKHLRDNLAKPEGVKQLREVCREVTGRDLGIRITVKEQGASDDGQTSVQDEARLEKQRLREMAERHSFTQQVLNTFHAEIVDVRRIDEKQ